MGDDIQAARAFIDLSSSQMKALISGGVTLSEADALLGDIESPVLISDICVFNPPVPSTRRV